METVDQRVNECDFDRVLALIQDARSRMLVPLALGSPTGTDDGEEIIDSLD